MLVGNVIGNVTSTVKHSSMNGQKLLVVQPTMADNTSADGDPLIAIDMVGAGIGERVVLTSDSLSVREFLNVDATPARWTVAAIED
ncbi:MAG: EutN/CcmL family microcompartment protein [Planctomycetales bacterium]|nr:EutN/CcmL family microcompartment protein [Planctomycetales bacterium]